MPQNETTLHPPLTAHKLSSERCCLLALVESFFLTAPSLEPRIPQTTLLRQVSEARHAVLPSRAARPVLAADLAPVRVTCPTAELNLQVIKKTLQIKKKHNS